MTMSRIPIILQGDDTSSHNNDIKITLPTADYTGLTISFSFLGHTRQWYDVVSGNELVISFTADETKVMPVGTHRAELSAINVKGISYCISRDIRIKVTSSAEEAYGSASGNIGFGITSQPIADKSITEDKLSNELSIKISNIDNHVVDKDNPHCVTLSQVSGGGICHERNDGIHNPMRFMSTSKFHGQSEFYNNIFVVNPNDFSISYDVFGELVALNNRISKLEQQIASLSELTSETTQKTIRITLANIGTTISAEPKTTTAKELSAIEKELIRSSCN